MNLDLNWKLSFVLLAALTSILIVGYLLTSVLLVIVGFLGTVFSAIYYISLSEKTANVTDDE